MIAHESKHYSAGGTGLRSVLDTYVFLSKVSLDMEYVEAEAEKLGIRDFEKENRSLAMRLFGGGELTAADREMLEYILSSGTYGTAVHKVENKLFYQHKVLLPFLPFYRTIRAIRNGRLRSEASAIRKAKIQ